MKLLIFLLACLVIYSCSKTPKDIIPRSKMENVLFDYIQTDVYSSEQMKDSTKEDTVVQAKLAAQVFKKHGITRDEFLRSFAFYSKDPIVFKNLLDSTVAQHQRLDTAFIPKGIIPTQGL